MAVTSQTWKAVKEQRLWLLVALSLVWTYPEDNTVILRYFFTIAPKRRSFFKKMANICIISEFKIEQIQNYFQMTYLFIVSGGFRTGETICKFKRAEIKWSVINPCIQYSICSLKKVHIFSFCFSQFFLKQLNTHWMWRRWFSYVSESIRMPSRFAMENSSCP